MTACYLKIIFLEIAFFFKEELQFCRLNPTERIARNDSEAKMRTISDGGNAIT